MCYAVRSVYHHRGGWESERATCSRLCKHTHAHTHTHTLHHFFHPKLRLYEWNRFILIFPPSPMLRELVDASSLYSWRWWQWWYQMMMIIYVWWLLLLLLLLPLLLGCVWRTLVMYWFETGIRFDLVSREYPAWWWFGASMIRLTYHRAVGHRLGVGSRW